jgi:hypothetical protein
MVVCGITFLELFKMLVKPVAIRHEQCNREEEEEEEEE